MWSRAPRSVLALEDDLDVASGAVGVFDNMHRGVETFNIVNGTGLHGSNILGHSVSFHIHLKLLGDSLVRPITIFIVATLKRKSTLLVDFP